MSAGSAPIAGVRGCCHVYHALDIGFAVDLKRCTALLREAREGRGFQHQPRTPASVNLRPLPVFISQKIEPLGGRTFRTEDAVTITIYDFGAVSVQYRVPFAGAIAQVAEISGELYDCRQFAADARARAESLLQAIRPAVKQPMVREESEDYHVFVIPDLGEGRRDMERFLAENGRVLAQVISSNTKELSAQQQQEELSGASPITPTT